MLARIQACPGGDDPTERRALVTTWVRLEPVTRSDDLKDGLAAKVHDPLWFLTRQWQMGEFKGEDAGTPITVRTRVKTGRAVSLGRGAEGGPSIPIDDTTAPLEALVEREPLSRASARRLAVESGRKFDKLLRAAGHDGVADNPDHMVHFDGEKFLGPYSKGADVKTK